MGQILRDATLWIGGQKVGTASVNVAGPDPLAEARAERRHGSDAGRELSAGVSSVDELFGRTLGHELRARLEQIDAYEVACDRYERAISERDERIGQLEAEVVEERSHSWAARALLRSAVRTADRWIGSKKGRRSPSWHAAAVELLSKRADGR